MVNLRPKRAKVVVDEPLSDDIDVDESAASGSDWNPIECESKSAVADANEVSEPESAAMEASPSPEIGRGKKIPPEITATKSMHLVSWSPLKADPPTSVEGTEAEQQHQINPVVETTPPASSPSKKPKTPKTPIRRVRGKALGISSDHRHKPPSVYLRDGRIARLAERPEILSKARMMPTNGGHNNFRLSEKINRAWGRCVGPGPPWELIEDRMWFNESSKDEDSLEPRPQVYQDLTAEPDSANLSAIDASIYLPKASPLKCSLGPFDNQKQFQFGRFETQSLHQLFPESSSHVFYAGAPVLSLDWCSVTTKFQESHGYKQYLAVSTESGDDEIMVGQAVERPSPSHIQIWTLGKHKKGSSAIWCSMILCLDCGSALTLRWCPLPSHKSEGIRGAKRLGLLAGAFEDGTVSIISVPVPEESMKSLPTYVQMTKPVIRIQMEETVCTTMEWANSDLIAVGCANGTIATFKLKRAMEEDAAEGLMPLHYFHAHQCAIRSISWVCIPPASVDGLFDTEGIPIAITSGGYDGVLTYTDIREQMSHALNRTRDVLTSVAVSQFANAVVTSDADNTAKMYTLSPMQFGRGHHMVEAGGPITSVSVSDMHAYIAVGSADGSCQTTNSSRSNRRGLTVPLFAHKIFQLDYSRELDEYRMLENFLPRETFDKQATTRLSAQKPATQDATVSSGVWPPEVTVTCSRWYNGAGIGQACWLASATASGLCRVDWVTGRFLNDHVPYTSIEKIREEAAGTLDDDEDELSEDD